MRTALLLAALASACTLDPGRGFVKLESVELESGFEPGERELDGGMLTDFGYVVHLDAIGLSLFELELATFEHEPEGPPEGEHAHCHDEACETESTESEPHEEHGDDEGEVVATLPVERGLDVLAGELVTLTRVEPSPELPAHHLERAELHVGRIELTGSVSGGPLTDEIPLSVSLDLATHAATTLDIAVDSESPERLSLHGAITLEGPLFDGVDFAAEDAFDVDDADDRAEALRSALAAALHLTLETEEVK